MSATTTEQIKYLLPCPWCQCQPDNSQKGNRRHLLLHCTNGKISKFRQKINNVIGSRLASFFEELEKKTSEQRNIELIYEIESRFLKLQSEQTGRLKELSQSRNILYTSIASKMEKLQVQSIDEAIKSQSINFFYVISYDTRTTTYGALRRRTRSVGHKEKKNTKI